MEIRNVLREVVFTGPMKLFSVVRNHHEELRQMGDFRNDLLERIYAVSVRVLSAVVSAAILPLIILGFAYEGYKMGRKRY